MKTTLLQIDSGTEKDRSIPVLQNGFRIFFLGAGLFAITAIAQWMSIYIYGVPLALQQISVFQWHAHEMIYGYSLAVIAGFLLTAAGNWTNSIILNGWRLGAVFGLWAIARIAWMFGDRYLLVALLAEGAFLLWIFLALAFRLVEKRQWKQMGLLSKVLLLGIANSCFYLGYFGVLESGAYWGVYGGLYLVIGIILTMGRRVVPFFIERGVGYAVQLHNWRVFDIASLVLFLLFFIAELFLPESGYSYMIAIPLFLVSTVRLAGWYTHGIWRAPLLWSLYLAIGFIDIGFLLFALVPFSDISKYLAVHAFAVGGIGTITVSMMSRVSLGHTGREVAYPPQTISYVMASIVIAAIVRVVMPAVLPAYYVNWVLISQVMWIAAFLLFIATYLRILVSASDRSG